MSSMLEKLGEWCTAKQRFDDDLFDRISHRYSTAFLIAVSLLTGGRQLMNERIRCFCPAEFNYHQTNFVNDYCYVANTYYVPISESLPGPSGERSHKINYYQWVTLFLLLQAVMFLIPKLLWQFISDSRGYYISSIVQQLHTVAIKAESPEQRKAMIDCLVTYTDRFLEANNTRGSDRCCRLSWQRFGGYLTDFVYTFIKLLYLANSLGQIYLVNRFLGGHGYHLWGVNTMVDFIQRGVVPLSDVFPIMTMCDVDLRGMGSNVRKHTVQCVLPVNVFHDRLYLLVWFWLAAVSVLTAIGLIYWIAFYFCVRRYCVKKYLLLKDRCAGPQDEGALNYFLDDYLSSSGLFMLKIASSNTPSIEFVDYLAALWDYFKLNRLRTCTPYGVSERRDSSGDSAYTDLSAKRRYKPSQPADYIDADGDFVAIL